MDHRPPAADGLVAALGSSLRRQLAQRAALHSVAYSTPGLTVRRTAARTARRLAPETADRLIAQLKGTVPLPAPARWGFSDQPGSSGAVSSKAAEWPRTGSYLAFSPTREMAAPGGPGPETPTGQGRPMRRRSRALRASAALTVAAVVGSLAVGPDTAFAQERAAVAASAATAVQPTGAIYPRPQSQQSYGTPAALTAQVVLVAPDSVDAAALAALRAAFKASGVARVDTAGPETAPRAGVLTVYLGGTAEGAGAASDRALRALAAAGGSAAAPSAAGLVSGGYVLATGQLADHAGVAVLSGVDGDGTFNAVQSFRQLLGRVGTAIPAQVVRDWPTAVVRGTEEGFYGTPWTDRQTLDLMDFLGRTKQNFFLYAPGDDPYRNVQWRDAYPDDRQIALATLAQRAAANHVTLGYALSFGQSLCYTSGRDRSALLAKLESLYAVGFRSFQLQFTDVSYQHWHCTADRDAYGHGPAAAAQGQADLVAFVLKEFTAAHPDAAPLSVLPSEYHQQGSSDYRAALAKALDPRVEVAWTGVGVQPGTITTSELQSASRTFGHPLATQDNYPVNDSAQDRLYLGAYQGRAPAVAASSAALLVNAMEQPLASRIPLFTAADFAWNPSGYDPSASWQAALTDLAGSTDSPARAALAALAGNSASSQLGQEESAYLRPLLAAFWSAFEPTAGSAGDAAQQGRAATALRQAFTVMAGAPQALAGAADGQLAQEDGPWLDQLALYGQAGQAAVDMLAAQRAGHGSAAWHSRVTLRQLMARIADGGVTLGAGVLDAFLDRTLHASDSWAGLGDGQLAPTTTLGTAQDHDPALMVDEDRSSYYWTDAPPQAGDAIGVDLGTTRAVGTVRITMGGPNGDVASDDYLRDAVLEYATQDSGWQQVAAYRNRKTITAVLPAGTMARYVRLRALSGQDNAVAVRSFRVEAPGSTTPTATAPAATAGTDADDVVDGTLDTPYRAAAAPTAGAALTVALGRSRPLNRVVVFTDSSVHAPGWVEVRDAATGVWHRLGALSGDGYTELAADPKLRADRIRLVWAAGAQAPVVYQVVPWYADTPAATLQLPQQSLDLEAGAVPATLDGVLQSQGAGGASGTVSVTVPKEAKGLTVTGAGTMNLPRGGQAAAPLRFTAGPTTPVGDWTVRVALASGGRTVTQDVTVHVHPATTGPDLALTATASSSGDETPDFPAAAVNDGDPMTRWSSAVQDDAWLQLELASPAVLGKVVLHWQDAYAAQFAVQTSMDGVTWTTAALVRDGRGGDETVRFPAAPAQFVRIQGVQRATRFGYSLFGVELYAVAGTVPPPSVLLPSPLPTTPDPSPSPTPTSDPTAGSSPSPDPSASAP